MNPTQHEMPPAAALVQMCAGPWVSQSLYAVATLGVADALADGPRPVTDIAARVGADPRALYRVLRALAGFGLFTEEAGEVFALTPRGAPLCSEAPDTVRNAVMMLGDEHYRAWDSFLHSVKTGESAFTHAFGQPVFDYYRGNPEAFMRFGRAMSELSRDEGPVIAQAYDFSGVHTVLDVGGGNGEFLSALLGRHEHLSGILFDLEFAVSQARAGAGGPLPRCELISGDFLTTVPKGADLITIKNTLHNWSDEHCVTILENCRTAMPAHGRVLVLERTIGPPNQPSFASLLDLQMMALPGGQARTEEEHARLLSAAGLKHTRTLHLPVLDIVEAVPA
ncbi:methyltransferase [Streptomyces wedmorensis]